MRVIGEIFADLPGVVMQEIHGFTYFGNGVIKGFSRLAHQHAEQVLQLRFHQFCSALQDGGTFFGRCRKPD
ncbi:hypothetical protein SRABI106_04094 [Rahnella aquatilis]|nr:hypothetical protein SRABI106_04094 [Rahnella aquatilis]